MVREGTEGPYTGTGGAIRVGTPTRWPPRSASTPRSACERVVRDAFARAPAAAQASDAGAQDERADLRGQLWSRTVQEVGEEYPDVEVAYQHVDAATIHMVTDPGRFDVIVTDNLFGDIITDLAAAVCGGIGLAASGNIDATRTNPSMFEPVHGSAPDIAGQGIADPTAAIMSVALLLSAIRFCHVIIYWLSCILLTPPFYINEEGEVDESLRLTNRYLDLRRSRMQRNIIVRHQVVKFMRDFFDERGFLEIETPLLIKSTPEGARDFLVPSSAQPGEFYALPQSPQQLKQLLMVSGFDRYFQIARCFRDEAHRADRQPEFTQLDLEMSFVREEDIIELIEGMFIELMARFSEKEISSIPFTRLTYDEAMSRFGIDRPDLRFGLELQDVSTALSETTFNAFKGVLEAGGQVKAIVVPGCATYTRTAGR